MYVNYIKRFFDFTLSLLALIVLSPIFLILTILGAIMMRGNPFFIQLRAGKDEKMFKLIKFRTMTCEKDECGNLLPDEKRSTKYGKFLRSTSLDELPELYNILIGQMSIVGPRPLMARYLPYYTEEEKKRHIVRPGLTGYAQIHGRNMVSWEERFKLDIYYTEKASLFMDIYIIFRTVRIVLKRDGIETLDMPNFDAVRKIQKNEMRAMK